MIKVEMHQHLHINYWWNWTQLAITKSATPFNRQLMGRGPDAESRAKDDCSHCSSHWRRVSSKRWLQLKIKNKARWQRKILV